MSAAITVAWAVSLAGGSPGASAAAPAAPAATIRAEATTLVITRPEASSREVATDGSLASSLTAQSGSRALHVNSVKRDQPSGFETMWLASFKSPASLQQWTQANAERLAAPLTVRSTRVLARGGQLAPSPSRSVFKISYYSLTAPAESLSAWVDGYLSKYLEAQRSAGILTSYAMYLDSEPGVRALLVLEYPDADTERTAEPRKEKLSEELAARDAEYARQMNLKESLRRTDSWTLAVPVG